MVLGFLLHSPEVFPCAVPIYNPVGSAPHLCLAVREAQMTGVHYEVVPPLSGCKGGTDDGCPLRGG